MAEKIPALKAEKKAHATNKKFKEAAEVVKTLKTLTTRKDEVEGLTGMLTGTPQEQENRVAELAADVAAAAGSIKAADRLVDLARD